MKKILLILLLNILSVSTIFATSTLSLLKKHPEIITGFIGFGVNVVDARFIKPNTYGALAASGLYAVNRILGGQTSSAKHVLSYTCGSSIGKAVSLTLASWKKKCKELWNKW